MDTKIWCIERNASGDPINVGKFLMVAETTDCILAAIEDYYIYNKGSHICQKLIYETQLMADDVNFGLHVRGCTVYAFPLKDVFRTEEDANEAVQIECPGWQHINKSINSVDKFEDNNSPFKSVTAAAPHTFIATILFFLAGIGMIKLISLFVK